VNPKGGEIMRTTRCRAGAVAILSLVLSAVGCARVRFYKDEAHTQETGIKYHEARPHLLVVHTGQKDNPVRVELISMPDLEHPRYAVYEPGWGTHKFSLKLQNGIMTEFGQDADSKGPETLRALVEGVSAAGGLTKEPAGADGTGPGVTLYEIRVEQGRTVLRPVAIEPP